MTDQQRSAFRFRVPRLRPVPPPRTTTANRTPARKPPVRPLPQPSTTQPAPSTPSSIPPSAASLPVISSLAPPPSLPQKPPAPSQKPLSSPPTPPQKPLPSPPQKPLPSPPTPQVGSLGTVPAQPPEPPVEPSPAQQEALVQPSPRRQDEPASMAKTPPSSPSQPHVSTKPTSPSTRLQPISQPSSPQHVHPFQQPEVKMSREIASSDHSNSESHIEENQHEIRTTGNIPNTPQTKSMISHPDDKIPVPGSPEKCKPNGPQQFISEETNPPNQNLNENPVIITLAGDNRGTSMHIGSGATKREKSIHIYRRYKVSPDESTDTMTDEEEKENDSKANENEENFSYINCNIQGINNSMVFNCSITEKSPGVHLGSCDRENVNKPKRKYIKSANMSKVKVNSTPSQKHTIRRRCLRGLFMESSDSDPNDHQA